MTTIRTGRPNLPVTREAPKPSTPDVTRAPDVGHPDASSFEKSNWAREVTSNLVGPAHAPKKRTVTFVYDAGPQSVLRDLKLKGSFDAQGNPSQAWTEGIPMRPLGDGRWVAEVELYDDGTGRQIEWGVTADSPSGDDQWAVFGEENLRFRLGAEATRVEYAPTTYHRMGAHKRGADGISFAFWAPNARDVQVKVTDVNGKVERLPMTRGPDGTWSLESSSGWKRLQGRSYVYELTDAEGDRVERADPYARVMQGEQRGLGRFYVDSQTGQEANHYTTGRTELMRFEIDDEPTATEAYLILKWPNGRALTKDELLERLGTIDPALISTARAGAFNDLWSENVAADGKIKLVRAGGSFTSLVNNPEALEGLRYELRAYVRDARGKLQLVDDRNRDGRLSAAERKASNYNDRWSDVITKASGVSFRGAVITDTSWDFKYDDVPREKDQRKWVIYQLHVGSFFAEGKNTNRSTFEDLTQRLDHLKELGINTIELLPVNEVEGNRDWGYMGVNTLAVESAYGFEDEKGNWVTGDQALKRFIDEAHKRGLNVLNDVVYNHVHGAHNHLWNLDGDANPYFNWSTAPGGYEQRETPWGAVPAYHRDEVKQLFVDHAVAQVADYHFDGLRFDFTEPIKGTGGKPGWDLLREINRHLHFIKPDVFTMAEQFDYDPAITEPSQSNGRGGGGFDAQWYTEFQHRLVRDNDNPGLVQAAANGQRTDIDEFMSMLTSPRGVNSWSKAVSMISNHDEVGNALRIIDVADGPGTSEIPSDWARGAARFVAGIGLTGPGIPMFFQGDESLAANAFKWGVPGTWDLGWEWKGVGANWDWSQLEFDAHQRTTYERLFTLTPEQRRRDAAYQGLSAPDRKVFDDLAKLPAEDRKTAMLGIHRRQTFEFYKAAIALRSSSPAFDADAAVERVYTHNDDSVLAFKRSKDGEEFVVVGSLNRQNLGGYAIDLPPGEWKEVFNSDAQAFGGSNFGNEGGTFASGAARLDIPAGGYIVLKKIA